MVSQPPYELELFQTYGPFECAIQWTRTSWSGWPIGSLVIITALIIVKIEVFAPIPNANVSTATTVKPGFFRRFRQPVANVLNQPLKESDLIHVAHSSQNFVERWSPHVKRNTPLVVRRFQSIRRPKRDLVTSNINVGMPRPAVGKTPRRAD